MESTRTTSKATTIVYWIVTALFCLEMSFTAYYMLLRLPEGAQAITRLGFPAFFRVELAWAKLLGVVLLLAPVPARLKEWAYAGFAINTSPRRSSPTSRWAMARRRWPRRRPPACSGGSRTSSGAACRP